jgi:predicted aspartyl protease
MRFRIIFGSALAVLFLLPGPAVAQRPWPVDCRLSPVARFPMTRHGNHVLIPVMVNGKTLNFIVDTGGYATAISKKAAAALSMRKHGIHLNRIEDVGGKDADSYVVADTFQMGHERAKNFELMVASLADGEDGILAPDLLRNFDVELDFGGMTMTLFRHHPCSDWAVYWTQAFIALPITVTNNGHMRVTVTLDGQEMRAILDTGAPMSLLSFERAGHFFDLDEKSPGVRPLGAVTGGSGGKADIYSYPFKSLAMGGVIVSHPRIFLTAGDNFIGTDNASLLLGMDALQHLHLYIAYGDDTLYVSDAAAK